MEEVAQKDKDYSAIIHAIRTGQGHKSLPHNSEGYKLGGEWSSMSIMEEAEAISVSGDDGIDRIFPPKGYRKRIILSLHQGGKHFPIVFATCSKYYRWPGVRVEIKTHVSNCRTCFENSLAKTEAQHPGLTIPLSDLSQMDWICCDLCDVKDKKGKKQDYLVIVDRYSSFIRAFLLGSTRTKNVIRALEEFIETYYGPPLLLTTDRGPQFSRSNNVIRKWATDAGINHKLSSAYSPQSNGEAEQAVKRIKAAIVHSDGTQPGITLACHTLKWEQQPDKTRSPAELFLNRPPRFPGLPTIPHKIIDNSDTKKLPLLRIFY